MEHKGVDILLQSFAVASLEEPDITCLIVGEGPERAALEVLARKLGVDDKVRFSDFVPDDEIYGVMKSSGVFVLPSIREGFGLAVLEANACGLPVITVRHPDNAARHLVYEGRNGSLVSLDVDDLAKGILTTLAARESMDPRAVLAESEWSLDWCEVARRVGDVMLASAESALTPSCRGRSPKED